MGHKFIFIFPAFSSSLLYSIYISASVTFISSLRQFLIPMLKSETIQDLKYYSVYVIYTSISIYMQYVYMYIYMYVCRHTNRYILKSVYACIFSYVCICVYIFTEYVYMYISIFMYLYLYQMCVCLRINRTIILLD